MKRYQGPCRKCGVPVDRKYRPGREHLCIDCALAKAAAQQRMAGQPGAPGAAKHAEYRAQMAAAAEAKEGPLYEKWRAGLLRAAGVDPDQVGA